MWQSAVALGIAAIVKAGFNLGLYQTDGNIQRLSKVVWPNSLVVYEQYSSGAVVPLMTDSHRSMSETFAKGG